MLNKWNASLLNPFFLPRLGNKSKTFRRRLNDKRKKNFFESWQYISSLACVCLLIWVCVGMGNRAQVKWKWKRTRALFDHASKFPNESNRTNSIAITNVVFSRIAHGISPEYRFIDHVKIHYNYNLIISSEFAVFVVFFPTKKSQIKKVKMKRTNVFMSKTNCFLSGLQSDGAARFYTLLPDKNLALYWFVFMITSTASSSLFCSRRNVALSLSLSLCVFVCAFFLLWKCSSVFTATFSSIVCICNAITSSKLNIISGI